MRNIIRKLIVVICIGVLAFVSFNIGSYLYEFHKQDADDEKLIAEITGISGSGESEASEDKNKPFVPDGSTYGILHNINSDYRGWLLWDSGIISTPIMQSEDDSYYVHRNIYRNEVIGGSAFIESGVGLDSANLPIYGHSVFVTNTATTGQVFSPMHNLTRQSFYNSNHSFKIYWENDVASYEVISVSEINQSTETWNPCISTFYSEDQYNDWITQARNKSLIQSSFEIQYGDRYVTFQTCKYRNGDERIIVIAKEVSRQGY